MFRIGQGYDIHRLAKGEKLILGGIHIPFELGSVGHSDADALIHAIIDAILGALNNGDIGTLFPDNDPKFKNIDSKILLKEVKKILSSEKYQVVNIDTTIILEKPKLRPFIPQMKKIIAEILNIDETQISIKAKTKEKLDAVGNMQAIEAWAVCLLKKAD